MVTAAKKKVSPKSKVSVVSAKVIATAAKLAPVNAAAKPVKVNAKAAPKPSAKPAAGSKVAAKKGVAKVATPAAKKVQLKPAVKSATKPVNKPKAPAVKVEKIKKPKLVRDSFTMPEAEYAVLGDVKKACLAAGVEVKKSQLLRIGLELLKKTEMTQLKAMIAALPALKAGRPKLAK
ncbi:MULTISPECIES: hypothetical protein [Undibacterium]|uniref:hypothetical protein n=1 Tax=Undibacterium TaxID=401469 RepID=UPI00272ABF50|nr:MULTISPECIES: hypothetical protein [Undibacterium]